jgi:hypothetical protein
MTPMMRAQQRALHFLGGGVIRPYQAVDIVTGYQTDGVVKFTVFPIDPESMPRGFSEVYARQSWAFGITNIIRYIPTEGAR